MRLQLTMIAKKSNIFSFVFLLITLVTSAQSGTPSEDLQEQLKEAKAMTPSFGIKAGYNVAKLTGSTPNYSPDTKNGFMVAAFFAPASRSGIGYRSELVFSRQGFGFDESGKKTSVVSDYLYLPQFTTIGITKFVQLQVGGQIGYLLKSSKQATASSDVDITSWANRLDYGAAFGAEIYPIKSLIIGGRYNMSFGSAYKVNAVSTSPIPNPLPFNPDDVKSKNAVINFYVGFRF
ncbi:MAG: PorT family protein [Chitinophagaceae bacterium]|nr:MAG: PorT family protein [Chitinophagaceae bacterium]